MKLNIQNPLRGLGKFLGLALGAAALLWLAFPPGLLAQDSVPGSIPRDARGLPLWEIAQWNDFPVRLELADVAELNRLLGEVPLASFQREQITPHEAAGEPRGLIFEPRVTEAEASALEAAGYRFVRLPDLERESRRAMEQAWAAEGLKSGADLKRQAAGYYPTHAQIGAIFAQLAFDHSDICRTFTWGQSVQGRDLWGLVISADPQNTAAEPEVRLSSSMHGDETVGMVMLVNFAEYLTENYDQTGFEDVTSLVDNYEIHIMPLHNPDGYVAGNRVNANLVDLNRNFAVPAGTHPSREIETIHFMNYGLGQHFVISQNGHSGALVANYPWDYTPVLAPDDAALIQLSLEYSTYNLPMYNGAFPQGITNGFDWYVAYGTLQDWSYFVTGCIDVTMELSNVKNPPASQLDGLWDDNRESLMHFVKAARYGINGVVTAAGSGLPLDALVTVVGNSEPVATDPAHGDYYKLLDTGTYDLLFEADGYQSQTVTGVATVWGTPQVLDVALVADVSDVPDRLSDTILLTASPNPFNPRTRLALTNPRAGRVTLDVYDLAGRRVRRLLEGHLEAGRTEVFWDGLDDRAEGSPAGIYFARMASAGRQATVKLVLVK